MEENVPRFIIDLSKKPRDRYVALATAYKDRINHLTSLFDQLLADLGIPNSFHRSVNRLAHLTLRKLKSFVETEELRGISNASGIPMYLLVAFNVVLDLLMGCTSGAVRCCETNRPFSEARMLHFRTLDWGMDPLRSVIVQLDFIRSEASSGQEVIASSITYVGFVGVLTGRQNARFYLHHLLVLFGVRPSISSLLRSHLYDGSVEGSVILPKSLASLATKTPQCHSTAAYLTYCDGSSTITIEKDYSTGVVRESQSFIAITNHDLENESWVTVSPTPANKPAVTTAKLAALEGFLDESADRRDCLVRKWESRVRKEQRRQEREYKKERKLSAPNVRTRTAAKQALIPGGDTTQSGKPNSLNAEISVAITQEEVVTWLSAWPTTNECTHYAAVMDPSIGKVIWLRRYPQPVEPPHGQDTRAEYESAGND